MNLFFVVRTDVAKGDGLQRVFGAFDTGAEAEAFMTSIQVALRGEFAVYEGHPVVVSEGDQVQ